MRRQLELKSRKLLAGPYLFWSVSFIIIPLFMVVYYGLTDKEGGFTLLNLARMTTPENLKALGLSLLLSFGSTLICLLLAYPLAMILAEKKVRQSSFIVLIFILPMWMNFLLRTLAWQNLLEKNRSPQQYTAFFSSAVPDDHQYSLRNYIRYGLQFSPLWYFLFIMSSLKLIEMLSLLPETWVQIQYRHLQKSYFL